MAVSGGWQAGHPVECAACIVSDPIPCPCFPCLVEIVLLASGSAAHLDKQSKRGSVCSNSHFELHRH